ncbi:uncharacterized protein WM277_001054 [Molossus nigricans]
MGSSTPPLRRRHRCPSHLQHCRTATTGDPAVRVFPDVASTLISDVFTHLGEDRLRAPHRTKDRSCQMGSSTPPLRRKHRCPSHLQHCRTATTGVGLEIGDPDLWEDPAYSYRESFCSGIQNKITGMCSHIDPAVRVYPDVGSTLIFDVFTHLREDRLRAPHRRKNRSCQMGSSTPLLRRRHRCPTHLQCCRMATTGTLQSTSP